MGLFPRSLLVGVFHPCCGKRRSGLVLLSSSPSPRLSSCYPLRGGHSQLRLLPIPGGSPVPTPSPGVPHHGRVLLYHVLHHLLDLLRIDFIWQDESGGVQAGGHSVGAAPAGGWTHPDSAAHPHRCWGRGLAARCPQHCLAPVGRCSRCPPTEGREVHVSAASPGPCLRCGLSSEHCWHQQGMGTGVAQGRGWHSVVHPVC